MWSVLSGVSCSALRWDAGIRLVRRQHLLRRPSNWNVVAVTVILYRRLDRKVACFRRRNIWSLSQTLSSHGPRGLGRNNRDSSSKRGCRKVSTATLCPTSMGRPHQLGHLIEGWERYRFVKDVLTRQSRCFVQNDPPHCHGKDQSSLSTQHLERAGTAEYWFRLLFDARCRLCHSTTCTRALIWFITSRSIRRPGHEKSNTHGLTSV